MSSDETKKSPICVDMAPAERWHHSGRTFVLITKDGPLAARALEEHLLDVLQLQGWLNEAERKAGLRFHQDFHAAGLGAHLTSGYSPIRSGSMAFGAWEERSDKQEAAYQKWRQAIAVMTRYSDHVISVACYEEPPTNRQALQVKQGLKLLAKWYEGALNGE